MDLHYFIDDETNHSAIGFAQYKESGLNGSGNLHGSESTLDKPIPSFFTADS